MDVFRRGTRPLTLFFIFCYFIAIVVGPEITFRQKYCISKIHEVFRVSQRYPLSEQSYIYYAVLYLRLPKYEEIHAYYRRILALGQQENVQYLLYDSQNINDPVINEEIPFKYYNEISDKFEKGETLSPTEYCRGVYDCVYALEYFRFVGDMETIIRYAFSSIVIDDIMSDPPFRDDIVEPQEINYAVLYLYHIARNLYTNNATMIWPFQHCWQNNYLPV